MGWKDQKNKRLFEINPDSIYYCALKGKRFARESIPDEKRLSFVQ
jgi:hypothetical protein